MNLTDSLPLDNFNKGIDTLRGGWDGLDGFSPLAPAQVHFPGHELADTDVSVNRNSPRFWNISTSLLATSSTVLLDTSTGEKVSHWVEIDHSFGDEHRGNRALLLWPAHRLKSGTRYIIAIRDLHDANGIPVRPSPYFTRLRDRKPGPSPARTAAFDDIFRRLSDGGVPRETLQIAWDFTTGSRLSITSRLVSARDDALQRHPTGPAFTITNVTDHYNAHIARKLTGIMFVPQYLNQVEPGASTRLVLDAKGLPVFQGHMPVTFEVLIPNSVIGNATGKLDARVVQYGHGLFGDKSEVQTSYLAEDADRYGYILVASDWIGLAAYDEPFVAAMMAQDLSNFAMVPDRCTQGVVNALLLMRLMKGPDGGLLRHPSVAHFHGERIRVDGETRSYFGYDVAHPLGSKWCHKARFEMCFLRAPSTEGSGAGCKTRLESRTKIFNPHFIYD